MSLLPKTALVVFLAVTVLSMLLLASSKQPIATAQQPDYTAQCSNGIAVPDPQDNPGLVSDCAALLAARDAFAADTSLDWSSDALIDGLGRGRD